MCAEERVCVCCVVLLLTQQHRQRRRFYFILDGVRGGLTSSHKSALLNIQDPDIGLYGHKWEEKQVVHNHGQIHKQDAGVHTLLSVANKAISMHIFD